MQTSPFLKYFIFEKIAIRERQCKGKGTGWNGIRRLVSAVQHSQRPGRRRWNKERRNGVKKAKATPPAAAAACTVQAQGGMEAGRPAGSDTRWTKLEARDQGWLPKSNHTLAHVEKCGPALIVPSSAPAPPTPSSATATVLAYHGFPNRVRDWQGQGVQTIKVSNPSLLPAKPSRDSD